MLSEGLKTQKKLNFVLKWSKKMLGAYVLLCINNRGENAPLPIILSLSQSANYSLMCVA